MADDTKAGNIALLIDADNASPHALDPVLTVLAELGTVNIRRVYGNWRKQALKTWADLTLRHGIEPHQQFDLTKGKNATDMKMTIRSEEHTSELQSLMRISYAVFCLKKKKTKTQDK